jgi:hypothetical protein
MNARNRIDGGQSRRKREAKMKIQRQNPADTWREMFRHRRRMHDPMLVFNMSIFNFADGWSRTFNDRKIHENVR